MSDSILVWYRKEFSPICLTKHLPLIEVKLLIQSLNDFYLLSIYFMSGIF